MKVVPVPNEGRSGDDGTGIAPGTIRIAWFAFIWHRYLAPLHDAAHVAQRRSAFRASRFPNSCTTCTSTMIMPTEIQTTL